MDKNKKFPQNFLTKIAQIESSGGKNTEHEAADPKSMHVGTTAIGKYGLMPLTVQDIVESNPKEEDFIPLKDYMDFNTVGNPNVANLKQLALNKYLKANPMVEELLANKLKEQIEKNVHGNEQMGAVAWHAGSGAGPAKIQAMLKEKSKRGKAVRGYLNNFNKLSNVQEDVPLLQPENGFQNQPSLLGIMTSRPSVEKIMDEQAEDEIKNGLWNKLKNYLVEQYNTYKDTDEN